MSETIRLTFGKGEISIDVNKDNPTSILIGILDEKCDIGKRPSDANSQDIIQFNFLNLESLAVFEEQIANIRHNLTYEEITIPPELRMGA